MTTHALPVTHHRTTKIDGVSIFYREAGPRVSAGRPPAARLSDLIAHVPQPDTCSCGSLSRDRSRLSGLRPKRYARIPKFAYTFDRFGELVDGLSTSSASRATPCTSSTTGLLWAGDWR